MQDLETIKLLGEKLLEISLSNDFLDITLNSTDNKSRIKKKQGHIKIKSFCTVKEIIDKMKSQHMEWKRIIAGHVCSKGLVHKKYI